MKVLEKADRMFWSFVSSIFPWVRDTLLRLRIIWHEKGRQRYFLGWLIPEKKLDDLKAHLIKNGFGNHFIAWIDEGEYCGLRMRDGRYQYHIRLFQDGEIRGHYEKTPEYHPVHHFAEVGLEERREYFMRYLEGWVSDSQMNSGR